MSASSHKVDSLALYLIIFGALMLLLVATVAAGQVDMGPWNTVVAMVIAVIKAVLVILFFMHVRHGSKLTWVFVAAGFVWLGLMVGLTMSDYGTRNPVLPNSGAHITSENYINSEKAGSIR